MKKKYEKPSIIKLQSGLMNKFGSSPMYARKVRTDIDGVLIDDLVKEYGSPLFVFSEKELRKTFRHVEESFSTRYPNVSLGWSYKTNYLKAICAILHQEGAIAEVVSELEYQKARNLGIEGTSIIFNGPWKPMSALEVACGEGAIINIDNLDELYDLEKIASKLGKTLKVGIRLNMNTGIYPQWSRFGFNVESGQAMEIVKRMVAGSKLQLCGLHCHIGTFILEPKAYMKEIETMIKFGYEVTDKIGWKMEYLDIGGGIPSKIKLKGSYLPPDIGVPSVDSYAEKISEALYKYLRPGDLPKLYLEIGRGIVDSSGFLISTVRSSKRLPDGRRSYVVDAGVNLLFTSFWYKFNMEIDREISGMSEPSVIYGPLCMNIDVVDEGALLPPLDRGTRLIFSPVGAYTWTQSMQFIHGRPAIALVSETGEMECIREAEDLSDWENKEILPERLRLV